jgi:hypothetical protein
LLMTFTITAKTQIARLTSGRELLSLIIPKLGLTNYLLQKRYGKFDKALASLRVTADKAMRGLASEASVANPLTRWEGEFTLDSCQLINHHRFLKEKRENHA